MDENDGPNILVILGLLSSLVGFLVGGWFWINVIYVGFGLIIAGVVYKLADRNLTEGAFFAALFFGIIGAIIWIVIDMSREGSGFNSPKYVDKQTYYKRVAQGGYKCRNCMWFGKPGCPRNETLLNGEPCTEFRKW